MRSSLISSIDEQRWVLEKLIDVLQRELREGKGKDLVRKAIIHAELIHSSCYFLIMRRYFLLRLCLLPSYMSRRCSPYDGPT